MSRRYEKEISLRLVGDKVECQKYIARARAVLGEVWERDLELGGLDESWRRVILDQRAYVDIHASRLITPIVTITVTSDTSIVTRTEFLLKLAWKPEGIVLTPRTAAVPGGWGLPSRNYLTGEKLKLETDELGALVNEVGLTEDGSLPQVILNRYPNNKYLDLIEHIDALPGEAAALVGSFPPGGVRNPQLADSPADAAGDAVIRFQTSAVFGQPWSYAAPDDFGEYADGYYVGSAFWEAAGLDSELVAGVSRAQYFPDRIEVTFLGPQFADDLSELITESKTPDVLDEFGEPVEQWYCHKPEEKLYQDAVSEAVFLATNAYRVNAGEEPVYRMLRGDANSARMAGYVLTLSEGFFFHSHPEFLPGFRTTGGRVLNCTGEEPFAAYGDNVRENLAALPAGATAGLETAEELGQFVTDLWRNSPPHYANMIESQWTEFSRPFHSWSENDKYPQGTKGASHHIGSYGVNDYSSRSDTRDSSVSIPIVPPAEDAVVWAQLFCARSSWVPLYDRLHEGAYGTTGTFNGWNPWSHSNQVSASRKVGWNKYIYQLPLGLVNPEAVPIGQDPSPFLGCVGSAMIEIGGEKWVRAVYWESDTVLETIENPAFSSFPQEGDWVRMTVVRFPLKLMETSSLPWRPTTPAVYEVEYEFEWLLADGWLTNPPAHVTFNSTGDKFAFTMHKVGADQYTDALDYFAQDWTVDRSALPLPRVDIQCAHFEWDATLVGTTTEMTAYEPTPLVAAVVAWTDDATAPLPEGPYPESDKTTFYERTLVGTYEVFPHYDREDNLSYVVLDVNEKTFMKGNRDAGTTLPDEESYCYRVRKMIFPSGKEITYMQQYMRDRWNETFSTDPLAVTYLPWPGDGEKSFFCVIHYMDELNEDVVYSKITTEKIIVDYGDPNLWYRTDGDTDYIADLNPEPDPLNAGAEARIIEILGTIVPDATRQALSVYDRDGDNWAMDPRLPDTRWIYNTEFSPCTAMVVEDDSYSRVPSGYTGANTTGFTLPENVAVTSMTVSPGPLGPPYDPDDGVYKRPAYREFPEVRVDYPTGRPPFTDYAASCHTGYTYYGDSNCWYFGSGKLGVSFMRCNISPLFAKSMETRCKVVRYDGRIVVFVGIDHVHKFGLAAPTYFKPAGSAWPWSDWEANPPPEGQETFIWANFDLDEAVGIEEIKDIWPMGKIV